MNRTTDLEAIMRQEGLANYPHEACGLVVAQNGRPRIIICKNIAEDPRTNFRIDTHEYIEAAKIGEVIGVWHTHVDVPPNPSEADVAGCNASRLPWYILSVWNSEDSLSCTEVLTLHPHETDQSYEGRTYLFGVSDCYTLVRDYYKNEFGIVLGEYPRIERFWEKGLDFFANGYEEQGFKLLIDQEPEVGDLFIMQVGSTIPNHIGIYVGNDQMLHHCQGRLSRIDTYGGMWAKHTSHHLRHKTK
jgi:proteasome lid subunit RPN8/RPN11